MKDIHIYYLGASGGHICSHLLLQSGSHFCDYSEFPLATSKQEFREVFDIVKHAQWDIADNKLWKKNEFWPINESTASRSIDGMHRLYLSCSGDLSIDLSIPATRVLIYTDFETQMSLAMYKRANIHFLHDDLEKSSYAEIQKIWKNVYADLAGDEWPKTCFLEDINTLPENVLAELRNVKACDPFIKWTEHHNSTQALHEYYFEFFTGKIGDTVVRKEVCENINDYDYSFKLQDIIKSKGKALVEPLGLMWTDEHAALVNHWLSKHPKELQLQLIS